MQESLIWLRIGGALLGLGSLVLSFVRFRRYSIGRRDFVLLSLFGLSLLVVSVLPGSVNVFAGMLSLEDKQFGRLITLLIFSSFGLWLFVLALNSSDLKKANQFDRLVRGLVRQNFAHEHGYDDIKEITVIIPALNEARNLEVVLPRLPRQVLGREVGVLVVDDGSTDDTAQVVQKLGFGLVSSPLNRGGGAALRLGYDLAMAGGAQIVVTMDGDGQHRPEELAQLVEPLLTGEADFVIGSRVLGQREKDSTVRWVGIRVFNFVINTLAGTRITDCSSGYRAFKVQVLQQVILLQDQFHTAELIIDAARKRLRIQEVPITVLRRYSGHSKKGGNWSYGLRFARTVLKTWFR